MEFSDLGFRVLAPGDLSDTELDATLNMLYSRVQEQENNQIYQVSSWHARPKKLITIQSRSYFYSIFHQTS